MAARLPLGPSSIYDQLPVPKAAGPSRRTLCRLSADTLKLGLGLLGIPSLERMGGRGIRGIQAAAFSTSGGNLV